MYFLLSNAVCDVRKYSFFLFVIEKMLGNRMLSHQVDQLSVLNIWSCVAFVSLDLSLGLPLFTRMCLCLNMVSICLLFAWMSSISRCALTSSMVRQCCINSMMHDVLSSCVNCSL